MNKEEMEEINSKLCWDLYRATEAIQRVRELILEATGNGAIYVLAMQLLEALDGEQ